MTKRIVEIALCVGLFVGVASAGLAQGGDSVAKRQAAMKSMGGSAGGANAAAGMGDFAAASAKAQDLSATVHSLPGLFPAGTSSADGAKTRAKAEVWSDATGFKAAADKAAADADAVVAAADSKNADAVKAAVTAFQGDCNACHTKYRGPAVAA